MLPIALQKAKRYLLSCLILPGLILAGTLDAAHAQISDVSDGPQRILFLGDSLTEGYGVEPQYAYPALIQERLRKAELNYEVVNAGISGDTSSGGLGRLNWLLSKPVAVIVLALGANDGLRGLNPELTEKNLLEIVSRTRRKNPEVKVLVAGMLVPPNMGPEYSEKFRAIFPRVAEQTSSAFLPFLLEGVAGERAFNLADGIHPNIEGHIRVADNVWEFLEPLIKK